MLNHTFYLRSIAVVKRSSSRCWIGSNKTVEHGLRDVIIICLLHSVSSRASASVVAGGSGSAPVIHCRCGGGRQRLRLSSSTTAATTTSSTTSSPTAPCGFLHVLRRISPRRCNQHCGTRIPGKNVVGAQFAVAKSAEVRVRVNSNDSRATR